MWSLGTNPITPMIVPSGRTVPLFIVNAAQQRIGTGREFHVPRFQKGRGTGVCRLES